MKQEQVIYMPLTITLNMFKVIVEKAVATNKGANVKFSLSTQSFFDINESEERSEDEDSILSQQENYLFNATQAAYVQLNNYDRLTGFQAQVTLKTETTSDFILGNISNSSGLSYAIALSLKFRELLDKRDVIGKTIIASGDVNENGEVKSIGGLDTKIDAAFNLLSEDFIFFYPQSDHDEVQIKIEPYDDTIKENFKPVAHLCDALNILIPEGYDGAKPGETVCGGKSRVKGLSSFDEYDGHRFFGRENEVDKLFQKYQSTKNLIAVCGPSGVGKSSVVKAGLIFNLMRENKNNFKHKVTSPNSLGVKGSDIPLELIKQLFILVEVPPIQVSSKSLKNGSVLFNIIEEHIENKLNRSNQYLLYIDQFEEFLNENKIGKNDKKIFIELLVHLSTQFYKNIKIVLSIRNEFKGYFSSETLLLIKDVENEHKKALVDKYLRSFNYDPQPELLSSIAEELREISCPLPSLQFLLNQLEIKALDRVTKKQVRTLSIDDYNMLGGVKGALATVTDDKFKYGVEDLFFEMFVGCNNDNTLYRRKVSLLHIETIGELINDTTNELLKHKIVVYADLNKDTVEIAHESLINLDVSRYVWPKFRDWYQKRKDYLTWFNQVEIRYNNWLEEKLLAANDN